MLLSSASPSIVRYTNAQTARRNLGAGIRTAYANPLKSTLELNTDSLYMETDGISINADTSLIKNDVFSVGVVCLGDWASYTAGVGQYRVTILS